MTYQHLGDFGDLSLAVVVTSPPWYENAYLVHHRPSGTLALVDPGGDAPRLRQAVETLGATPVMILLTHGHPDHLGAAAELEQAYDIPTRAHEDEKTVIAAASDLSRAFTGQPQAGPTRLDLFSEPADLSLGGVPIRMIPTPGHSPGGVCYDFGPFVLTGDTLFRGGVGRTDLPGGSEQKLWDSIERLLAAVPDQAQLFSGHGPAWSAAEARRWWALAG